MNDALKDKIKKAQSSGFNLPKEITSEKEILPNGTMAYVFNHDSLGQLGRLLVLPHPSGQTQINYEVSGSPDDPLTQTRTQIITPIFEGLIKEMDTIVSSSDQSVQSGPTSTQTNQIKNMVFPCDECNAPAAMLFYSELNTNAGIENVARLIFDTLPDLDVPTWIVGPEETIVIEGYEGIQSLSLKVWPARGDIKMVTSFEMHPVFLDLMQNHCKTK